MSDSQSPIVTLTKPPFDKPNADIILRSSDNVDFRVFRQLLIISSPIFERMLSSPQPAETESYLSSQDGLPVIQLSESSEVLEALLMFCYPRWSAKPELDTLEEIKSVLEAAIQYDMEDVKDILQEMLVAPRFVEDKVGHLRVFGIAVRYQLKEAAEVAMQYTLRHSAVGRPYVEELDYVCAKTFYQLLDYHW
jgi:hypothetical protein